MICLCISMFCVCICECRIFWYCLSWTYIDKIFSHKMNFWEWILSFMLYFFLAFLMDFLHWKVLYILHVIFLFSFAVLISPINACSLAYDQQRMRLLEEKERNKERKMMLRFHSYFLFPCRRGRAHSSTTPWSWCMCWNYCHVGHLPNGHGTRSANCSGIFWNYLLESEFMSLILDLLFLV